MAPVKFDDLYIAGCGRWLPEPMTVAEAEQAGLCNRRAIWRTDIASVCVATSQSAPQMAAMAAEPALAQAGFDPAEYDLVLHAAAYYQGHDLWPPASYVQREVLAGPGPTGPGPTGPGLADQRLAGGQAPAGQGPASQPPAVQCPAIEIRQMSNGGMAAMELAASYLVADQARRHALITTGDRFCLPGFDRWRSDPGTICGDGGTAAVLSTRGGFARLHSLVTVSDPTLEKMSRGRDPFGDAPFSLRSPIDLDAQREEFVAELGLDAVMERIDAGQRAVVDQALADADAKLSELDWFVLPSLGLSRIKAHFLDPLGIEAERTTWQWGRHVGHLGAGDQIAGISHLREQGELVKGRRCLLLGVGVGFSWSAAVIEIA